MSSPRIAILGAGPGGLTCARVLYHHGFDNIVVFEGEPSQNFRNQGGTLDLHPGSGQQALREAGLFGEFEKYVRYEGEDFKLYDYTGKLHAEIRDTDTGRPEIDRLRLRGILLNSLPEGTIKWGKRAKSVEVGKIVFYDGTEESGFDLIVGADGAWSKVRPLLTHIPPFYSGISGLELVYRNVDKQHPKLSAMVGNGSSFIFGEEEKRAVLCQRNGEGDIRVYACGSKPEDWIKNPGFDSTDENAVKQAILKDHANWSAELKDVLVDIDLAKGDLVIPRSLYMLPVGLQWPSISGVTLLGDAAHLMTPFAGEGVNQAMQDGMELALEILKDPSDLNAAVKRYEKAMFPRALEFTQKTWKSLLARFAPGGVADFKGRISGGVKMLQSQGRMEEAGRIFVAED